MSRAALAALACAALALGGCGDDDGGTPAPGEPRPAEGGTLRYALASAPAALDPLLAADRASLVVTRQIHEPLVETLRGPFGDVRELPGLAQFSSSSNDRSIWRFRLRSRVRFQDGTPFNASAVLVNARRWTATEEGRMLLPGLVAVDAPRPDLVRFVLDRPDPAFPRRLSEPRLGLVSPRALPSPRRLRVDRPGAGTGTGAFEIREAADDGEAVLARNTDWWGTRFDLGPALDQLVFPVVAGGRRRVELLAGGEIDVADQLSEATARAAAADPLLTLVGKPPGPVIAAERSVRGIGGGTELPELSGAWLTTVGAGP